MKRQETPGTNFKRHMAIAKGLLSEDDRLLTEIMFNPYTIRQIELINSQLSYLTHIIRQRDYEEMQQVPRRAPGEHTGPEVGAGAVGESRKYDFFALVLTG